MTAKELIDSLAIQVNGGIDNWDVLLFTLSTCMWCKRTKSYLNEKDIKYRFIDVDKIHPTEKSELLDYLKQNYQSRISYPFVICDDDFAVGYDLKKLEELMKMEDA